MTSLTLTFLGLMTGGLIALLAAVARLSRHKRAAARARLDLLGASAVVETILKPEGSVLVRGELWR
ncbi:MAG TPA: hypothetical protein VE842_13100, partial [Pyrinomonadaceae bacterium]|nr:hypothetical protein [Pyrinomonadaceae bacterium]